MAVPAPLRRGPEILPVTLTKDGRLADKVQLERVAKAAGSATDCFLFCHGWLYDEAEAHQESARFFALLDGALAPLRERIVPLCLGLHWPSKPFADGPLTSDAWAIGLWPQLEHRLAARSRRRASQSDLALLRDLCRAEIPRSSEEEAELDALARQLTRSDRECRVPSCLAAPRAQLLGDEAPVRRGGRAVREGVSRRSDVLDPQQARTLSGTEGIGRFVHGG
jgi:hypothetical protein